MNSESNRILNPNIWVDKYADKLFGFALGRVYDHALAEDLVQETFLAGIKSANTFRGESSELTWLTSILKRKIIDYFRKASTKREKTEASFSETEQHFFDKNGHWIKESAPLKWAKAADFNLENEELAEALKLCISHLPQNQMAVFTMKYIDDEESEFICKELEISSSNFWVLMHRAKLSLRKCIERNYINE